MRMPNDVRLAEEVPELHLVLGGHDHHYEKREVSLRGGGRIGGGKVRTRACKRGRVEKEMKVLFGHVSRWERHWC